MQRDSTLSRACSQSMCMNRTPPRALRSLTVILVIAVIAISLIVVMIILGMGYVASWAFGILIAVLIVLVIVRIIIVVGVGYLPYDFSGLCAQNVEWKEKKNVESL